MGSVSDVKTSRLQVDTIESIDVSIVDVNNILQYNQAYGFTGNQLITYDAVAAMVAGPAAIATQVNFTNVTGKVINWQTDMVDGTSKTYFQLLSNIPNPFVFFVDSGVVTPGGQAVTWTVDTSGNILIMTFDWGTSQSGYITF